MTKLHLACGPNIVKGWDNLDLLKEKGVIVHDLRTPLPYKDGTVGAIFHEHFIEHLTKAEARDFLIDCHRVMKDGAAMRIGWPDMKKLINAYVFRKKAYMKYITPFFADHKYGDNWDEMMSDSLFGWEHLYAYTAKHLILVLKDAGFRDVKTMKQGRSDYGIALDFRRDPATTYIEAIK